MSKRKIFGEIPQEVSENIKAPENAPSDKRISGRVKQLNFKVREEFYWQLKNRAVEEKCMMVEVLERAFVEYEQREQVQEKKSKKVFFHPNKSFDCDRCGESFQNETAYSYVPSLGKNTKTYCGDCVEE